MRQQVRYAGRFLALCEVDGWEYCERVNAHGVVTVVAVTPADEVLLTEQFRPPLGQSVIELPAGLAGDEDDSGEALVTAAHRELLEETGWRAGGMRHLARGPSSAGLASEVIDFYLALDLERVDAGGGTESEDIQVHAVPRRGIVDWLAERAAAGRLIDHKVYAGLWWLSQSAATAK